MLLTNKAGRFATGVLGATILMATMMLSGCDKIADMFSSEQSFLSLMDGRWSDPSQNGGMFYANGGKLVGVDTKDSVIVIQPTGKFDADNQMLPVKMTIISPFKTKEQVIVNSAKVLCPDWGKLADGILASVAQDEFAAMGAGVGAMNCIKHFVEEQGHAKLREKLIAAKAVLKEGLSYENVILYNASLEKDKLRIGIKTDDGKTILDLDFVRNLSADEQQQLEAVVQNPRQKFAASDALVDKTIDDLVEIVAKNETKAKSQADADAFIEVFDAARPLTVAVADFMFKTSANSLSGDNAWKELGLEVDPVPTKAASAYLLSKSGMISVTVAPGVLGATSCGNVTFTPQRINAAIKWAVATTCPDSAAASVVAWFNNTEDVNTMKQ
ncbi:MAG: hypothetical protein A2063_00710 [Gallionellales bacterium GWA2_60_142]|nr:MAG: hypothetical protein A2063_00710 [Gallionellales bacterium GWA2_60_142]HCI13627.1 hypothetical protein [Gallionellaceae bacterium]